MKLSDAEWQIMNGLWKKYPATAREVIENLESENDWAYTTVKTMLNRLVDKNVISERKRGNASVYAPLLSQQTARQNALNRIVDKVFGGTADPIMHYLIEEKKISNKERKKLLKILQAMDKKTEGN